MKKRIHTVLAAGLFVAAFFVNSVYAQPQSIELNSAAEAGSGFIVVDELFETTDGNNRELIMTGLKVENKDLMLQCLTEHYSEAEDAAPLKIIDAAFCDAEKYDNRDENADYDSLQCWAATAADMLWISGWMEHLDYAGSQPFSSEDEIFRLFNSRFSDRRGDVDRALDWFFMGEFFVTGTKKSAALLNPQAEDGFLKGFVSSLAQNHYDLTECPGDIVHLLKIGSADESQTMGQSVFQGALGFLLGGQLTDSIHSVMIAGVIIDPQEDLLQDQWKAVIIIDSDNDGQASEEEAAIVEALTADDETV